MGFELDHLVHHVEKPEEALKVFNKLGLHTVEGGRHENWGTYNALTYFGLSYIELIGVFDEHLVSQAAQVDYSLHHSYRKRGSQIGLSRVVLRSSNLEKEAIRLRALGLEVSGPHASSRTRPDGSVLTWKLLYAGHPNLTVDLPFFIEWNEPNESRLMDLRQQRIIKDENITLDAVGIAVEDALATAQQWSKYLNLKMDDLSIDDKLNAKYVSLVLPNGLIKFYSPLGDGLVKKTLEERGEGLFLIDFSGENNGEMNILEIFKGNYRFK